MAFRNFRLVCTIRILFLSATVALLFYLLTETELYATAVIVSILVLVQIWLLISYVDGTNRDLARFLISVQYSDFTASFPEDSKGGSHRELREAFESVLKEFRKTRSEKEEHYRYLQTVVQHIGVGLIAFDQDNEVDLFNSAARRLLGISRARRIADLSAVSPALVDKLYEIQPGSRDLLKLEIKGEMMQLSLAATLFRLGRRSIKLVSLQNIASELSEREMESWQQLVRVLTHEIMNSVTPIASLSSTAGKMLGISEERAEQPPTAVLSKPDLGDLRRAVHTIERRSRGLLHFVDAYRALTRIPKPDYQLVSMKNLLERVSQLMCSRPDVGGVKITTDIDPHSLELTADPDLIEQVLINLSTNAIQALQGRDGAELSLTSRLSERGRVIVDVTDNGPGIGEDTLESVFVPFFTTKPEGTGIGLSLSRQIMRLHKGDLTVSSTPNEATAFTLRF